MDSQWKRQVEYWLLLMGCPQERIALPLALLCKNKDIVYLEKVKERALVARARSVPEMDKTRYLLRSLALLHPEASDGLAVHAWLVGDRLFLGAMAPEGSDAKFWFNLSERCHLLLNRAIL